MPVGADFAYDLARPLPATTMFTWFGFPETDHPQLLDWFNDMLQRTSGERALPPVALAARDRLRVYIQDVARERRRRPGDDLMSFLVDAVAAGQIDDDELLGSSLLMFVAGITTTSGLISNSLLHLARFPDQRAIIVRDPATIPVAVEELLRFDAPIQVLVRTLTRDAEVAGSVQCRPAPRCSSCGPPPTVTSGGGTTRTRSICCVRPCVTRPSVTASTTVWVRRWPASKPGSCSRSSSSGSPRTR